MINNETPKTYKFSTFQQLFDRVPSDKIELCLTEIGAAFAMAKKPLEMAAEAAGIILDEDVTLTLPDEFEWIDDGKGEIKASLHCPECIQIDLERR
jgi:hypothetical protein